MMAFVEWLHIYAPTWYWLSGLPLVSGWQEAATASWIIVILWGITFWFAFAYTGYWYAKIVYGFSQLLAATVILFPFALLGYLFAFFLSFAVPVTPIGWISGMMAIAAKRDIKLFGKIPMSTTLFFLLAVCAVVILWLLPTIFWVGVVLAVVDAAYFIACVLAILYDRLNHNIFQVIGALAVTVLTPAGGILWLNLFWKEWDILGDNMIADKF